jgi:hypothetical protein
VLLFDYADGKLVSDFSRLRDNRVWILHPDTESGSLYRQSGEKLQPVETAPHPTGAWDGYSLQVFDLVDSERISVGTPPETVGRAVDGSEFWVRVRGDRITLNASAIPGVRTSEGLPVYSETPHLLLGEFSLDRIGDEKNSAAWSARIVVDGSEHEFDAAALANSGQEIIRSVAPDNKISLVRVTVRGPLGMDLRAEFCVIPKLFLKRPSNILLPSKTPNTVLAYVDASWPFGAAVRVPISPSQDTVEVALADVDGRKVQLLVSVPCLQWALVAESGTRSELDQKVAKVTSTELSSGGARLIVRTRRQGTHLELFLKEGDEALQSLTAETAGEDGRWAFDLRPYSDSVKTSTAVRLKFVLRVGGYDIDVGFVQAELDVQCLTVHQRVGNGDCTVALVWEQSRRLNDRVVRVWSLSRPWLSPITQSVINGDTYEASITRSQHELPPGFYLAEVAIDDGWTTPRRPTATAATTRQFRLDSEEHHAEWLESLNKDNPEDVLTYAAASGTILRQLTDEECEAIVPLALEALDLASSLQYPTVNADAVADLIALNPAAVVAGVRASALTWSINHSTSFLGSILPLLSAMRRSAKIKNSIADTSTLWDICPPLAAMHDLANLEDASSRESFETGSGARLGAARKLPLVPEMRSRVPELQRLIGRSADALDALRRACFLLPKQVLDLESQVAVQLEWLIADKNGIFSAEEWVKANRKLGNKADDLDPSLFAEFASVCAPDALATSIPAICFPEIVYVAALHVVSSAKSRHRAAMALHELIGPCPGIVSRSLILAAVHVYLPT